MDLKTMDLKTIDLNKIINTIKNKYGIEIKELEKKRSVYKLISDRNNIFCLKEVNHNFSRFKWLSSFLLYLKEKGFLNCPLLIKDNQNQFYFNVNKHKYYYLTNWIEGNECKIDEIENALNSIELLCEFHRKALGFNSKQLPYEEAKLIKEYIKKKDDIIRYKNLIMSKKIMSYFDILYIETFDTQMALAEKSLIYLLNSNYRNLNKNAIKNKVICHNSFYYQNIIKSDNTLYLIDFDKIIYETVEYDLGKFIQRMMFRKSYNWQFDKAKLLIDKYCKCYGNNIDYKLLLSIIIYPHKFWKLGNKKYDKKKNLEESYYIRRLKKIITNNLSILNFINEFDKYYINKNI
ncbi:CotS family spore coat protein [Caloramator proteoclasticus]|uniref:Spore coat protein, CotS family n=1 Tax=Caloramator proteoclasticus DSM 10124 TaxID=1121262 RepID=A0A1M4SRM3_9CLOT|nr:CotS family spore coat protein [Caloramator proteoclasticus]SHE34821.1 spore coat protein, CotS family [Caloramator proteoclasticus DSM 10124]